MGQGMSSSDNRLNDKRSDFHDKVEKEKKPTDLDSSIGGCDTNSSKPKGTSLEGGSDSRKVIERKAPSCGYKGG
jgi:hypothetical protein